MSLTPFGGTVNLGIKEAKRRGLRGKYLASFKSKAWDNLAAENKQKAEELEKAKKAFARKQKKAAKK